MSTQRLKVSQHVVHSFIGVLSELLAVRFEWIDHLDLHPALEPGTVPPGRICQSDHEFVLIRQFAGYGLPRSQGHRSEEHTSELQSLRHLVCRLLLEKKKKIKHMNLKQV